MESPEITQSIFNTRWTLISEARDSESDPVVAKRALELIIARYRPAVLGAVQRNGINPADCEDVCQEFLVNAFLGKTLPRADRSKGRFRTFLIHTLRMFLIDYRRRMGAAKRGTHVTDSMENQAPGGEIESALAIEPRMELEFEIDFAHCMHEEVLTGLRQEYLARKQSAVFDALSPHLLEKEPGLDKIISESLGMDEAAARKALSRLRQRYGERFLFQVTQIIDEDEDPRFEMKELLKLVLAKTRMEARAAA